MKIKNSNGTNESQNLMNNKMINFAMQNGIEKYTLFGILPLVLKLLRDIM